ncbi:hypothetical protein [Mycetocola saprophilus]|uniref:hypothetical protein n=1 Tax=Mycetocola saprophilus TaxID=76636 RepID=UPI003BEF990B
MNKERDDERAAKLVIEAVLSICLSHADHTGGVDYVSVDGRHAVEVTRVTDGEKRAGRSALRWAKRAGMPEGDLQTCWLVIVPEGQSGLKTFRRDVYPAIIELEKAGETVFWRQIAALHMLEGGPLSEPYKILLEAGVESASAVPDHSHKKQEHRVIPLLNSGGSSSGSNHAVAQLAAALKRKPDNPDKLKDSGKEHRHLFVWIDDDTPLVISRPLARDAPAWSDGEYGVPTVPPQLDAVITHLWIAHEGTGRGWLWDGAAWCEINGRGAAGSR